MRFSFVILVALDHKNFNHYCTDPKTFYESFEQANVEVQKMISEIVYQPNQIKIQKLWWINNKPC